MRIGLTGNIATGKSVVYKVLCRSTSVKGFDADEVVDSLYSDPDVIDEIVNSFGSVVLNGSGVPCRVMLRQRFLEQPDARLLLENIFHPRVRSHYKDLELSLDEGAHLVADIPLLFEKDVPYDFDAVIVVACSGKTQLDRLMGRSKLDRKTARAMIDKQVALSSKILKADYVLWNNGSLKQLHTQIYTLVHHLF